MRKTRKKLIYILLVLAVCAFTYLGYNLNNKELDSEETFQDNISEVNLVQNEENTEIVESNCILKRSIY